MEINLLHLKQLLEERLEMNKKLYEKFKIAYAFEFKMMALDIKKLETTLPNEWNRDHELCAFITEQLIIKKVLDYIKEVK